MIFHILDQPLALQQEFQPIQKPLKKKLKEFVTVKTISTITLTVKLLKLEIWKNLVYVK